MCLCHHGSAHTLSGAMLQNNKMVIKYCHDTIGSASSHLRTNRPFFKPTDTFSQSSLPPSPFPRPRPERSYLHHLSGTCQLQTITTINGLPLPEPPVAAGRSGGGERKLQRVQQQPFAFQGLVSIISGGGGAGEGMRNEYMQRGCIDGCLFIFYVFL